MGRYILFLLITTNQPRTNNSLCCNIRIRYKCNLHIYLCESLNCLWREIRVFVGELIISKLSSNHSEKPYFSLYILCSMFCRKCEKLCLTGGREVTQHTSGVGSTCLGSSQLRVMRLTDV